MTIDKILSAAIVAIATPLCALVVLVPALFVALPAAYFGQMPYGVVAGVLALIGGFWMARETIDIR